MGAWYRNRRAGACSGGFHVQQLPVDTFIERLADMPDVEALQEIELRMEHHALEIAVIQRALEKLVGLQGKSVKAERTALGYELAAMCSDHRRMKTIRGTLDRRVQDRKLAKAVRALFGDEGYEQCRIWMVETECRARTSPQ